MRKVVEEHDVLAAIEQADREAAKRSVRGERRRALILDRVREVLDSASPPQGKGTIPPLMGLAEAAQALGTKKQHITKLRIQKILVPIERFESGPVYRRKDVEAVAKQLQASRTERAEKAATKAQTTTKRAAR